MKIGIYFNSKHLDTWNWEEVLSGEIGLSGTDSQILHLAHHLANRGTDVLFFSNQSSSHVEMIKYTEVTEVLHAITLAKANKVDILLLLNREDDETIAAIQGCERVKQQCVVWCHNDLSPKLANLLFNSSSVCRVVCVSASQADNLRDHPVFDKTEFIYNAIDIALFDSQSLMADNQLSVCYLGSLTPSKGFQHLAKAWPRVRATIPKATLTVIGSAKLYNRNISTLGPLGVANQEFELNYITPYLGISLKAAQNSGVDFLGLLSAQKIRQVIATSSIGVVNPNCSGVNYETFCVSAVEFQASGVPVIGANREGLRETVKNKQTGILINREEELATSIIALLNNPQMARKMGKLGRQWVSQTFERSKIVDKWISLFNSIVSNQKSNPPHFSWKRANLKIVAREGIRWTRKIPCLRDRIPSLNQIKSSFYVKE